MKLLVSGASGLIGSTLALAWRNQGHQIRTLVRHPAQLGPHSILWTPPQSGPDPHALEGLDALVHLSGENIGKGRWTKAKKETLWISRVESTRRLVEACRHLKHPPKAFICASAIGFYGDQGSAVLTEESPRGQGFLADLCGAWEAAAEGARTLGSRVVHLRTGMVLSLQGGALPPLKRLFQLGLGGPVGPGSQYMSWITLEDVCGLIRQAVTDIRFSGPLNGVAPHPVTNADFSQTLAAALHRPHFFRLPAAIARLILGGEKADALLLSSLRVQPAAAERAGYRFLYPELRGALRHLVRE